MSVNPVSRPAIVVSDLVKSYGANRPNAVDGISFEVHPGEILGLLGPNGAGKTTTVKSMLGLVEPTAGSVHLAGYDMARQRHKALPHAGAVLEGSRNIYWRLSVRANLKYFGALKGLRGRDLAARVERVLAMADLADRADDEARVLSRGMQQKAALAVAVLHDPAVLLLDEPTLGLDVQAARAIENTVRQLASEQKRAIVLTTHQMALAERLCDRVLVIDNGKKVVDGPVSDVLEGLGAQQTIEVHVGVALDPHTIGRIRQSFPHLSVVTEDDATLLSSSNNCTQRDMLDLVHLVDREGLPILHIGRRKATLEEVFVRLTTKEEQPA
jgi:ABC-2 type transport system ATP-binding protein